MGVKPQKLSDDARSFLLGAVDCYLDGLGSDPAHLSIKRSAFKKLKDRKRNPTLALAARTSFLHTEVECRTANARVRQSFDSRGTKSYADGSVLYLASRKIAQILGSFDIEEMLSKGRFGPGSTYLCRGHDVSRARKFSLTDVTPEFNKIARGLLADIPLWAHYLTDSDGNVCPLLSVVPGGRYSTVPKDRTTDRSIIVEPTINSWFQQGLGRMIRSRLRSRVGVDLDDQTTNQRLARLGSVSNDLATVDLSSASDLICKKLVYDLLPPDWFFWLNITRSHRVLIGDEWVELEKFSSMGNGFTFDLQSLIFYAISWAITTLEGFNPFWVNVFGDDIIIPSAVRDRFLEVFRDCGFKTNVNKSFFEGPFRESCGKDYYLGEDVRGVYIDELETDLDVMKLHNRFYEWALRTNTEWSELRGVFLLFLEHIYARVPPILGDLGVTCSFDEACPPLNRRNPTWEGYLITVLLPILPRKDRIDRFLVLDRLNGSEDQGNFIPLRRDPVGYRYAKIHSLWE